MRLKLDEAIEQYATRLTRNFDLELRLGRRLTTEEYHLIRNMLVNTGTQGAMWARGYLPLPEDGETDDR